MIYLGIDQGLANCGYAFIHVNSDGRIQVLKIGRIKTVASKDTSERLQKIYSQLYQLSMLMTKKYGEPIQAIAIENLYVGIHDGKMYGRSKTLISTAMVSGVCLLLAKNLNAQSYRYVPTTIKKEITGTGKADKTTVIARLNDLFPHQTYTCDHESDALAIAYTCYKKEGAAS